MSSSLFVQEVGQHSDRDRRLYNVIYIRGIERQANGEERPYLLYVTGFLPTMYVDVEGWSPDKMDDLISWLREIDPKVETGYCEQYPLYFNKNKKKVLMYVKSTKNKKILQAAKSAVTLEDVSQIVQFNEGDFKIQEQFLPASNVRLQAWYKMPDSVRPGPSNGFFTTGIVPWRSDMFQAVECEEMVYNVAYLRCRFVSAEFEGKREYKPNLRSDNDYLGSVSVSIGGDIRTFTSNGQDDSTCMRQLLSHLKGCDTWVALEDNYRTKDFLAKRAERHGLCLSRIGRNDYSYMDKQENPVYCLKGVTFMDLKAAMSKEYAYNSMDQHDLTAFMDDDYFAGAHELGNGHEQYNASNATLQDAEERAMETAHEVHLVQYLATYTQQLEKMAAVSSLCDHSIEACASGGQQKRVYKCLYRKCKELGFFIDKTFFKRHVPIEAEASETTFRKLKKSWTKRFEDMDEMEFKKMRQRRKNAAKKKYVGGMVYDPVPGHHKGRYVFCCDFSALYPSIIIAYRICYCTVVMNHHYASIEEMQTDKKLEFRLVPIHELKNICVAVVESYDGEAPVSVYDKMVNDLLDMRRKHKKAMKTAKARGDTRGFMINNARQLSDKVTANSTYGFFGTDDKLDVYACNTASAVVTAHGRQMNQEVGEMFTNPWTPELIFEGDVRDRKFRDPQSYTSSELFEMGFNGKIIYGDTDSVMIDFGDVVKKLMRPGESEEEWQWKYAMFACEVVSRLFPPPNEVECEDAYTDIMFFRQMDVNRPNRVQTGANRKMYITWKASGCGKPKSLKKQGHGVKRRNNPAYARKCALKVIHIMWGKDKEHKVQDVLYDTIRELVESRTPLVDLIITCNIKDINDYKSKSIPQISMIEDSIKYDGYAPQPNSRQPFIYVRRGDKQCQMNPKYCRKERVPVDRIRYFENLRSLIMPILAFDPILRQTFHELLVIAVNICKGFSQRLPPKGYLATPREDVKSKRVQKRYIVRQPGTVIHKRRKGGDPKA